MKLIRYVLLAGMLAFLALSVLCFSSCEAPQAAGVTTHFDDKGKVAGVTTWAENGGTFFHKADEENNVMDVTGPNGVHFVIIHNAKKPDGTEATKFGAYDVTKSLARYTAHSTDLKTTTSGAPAIITAKGQAKAGVIKAQGEAASSVEAAKAASSAAP